jgi:hypothetical protein
MMSRACEQYRAGDEILDGRAVVLAVKGEYVLCVLPGMVEPFATWWVSARGEVLSGVYSRDLGDAIRSLTERSAK